MRWFKKIVRAILVLLPVFAVLLIPSANTSALKHDYDGILLDASLIPIPVQDNGTWVVPDTFDNFYFGSLGDIYMRFDDSVYTFDRPTLFNPNNLYLETGGLFMVNAPNGFSDNSNSTNCLYGNNSNDLNLRSQFSWSNYNGITQMSISSSSLFYGDFVPLDSNHPGLSCLNYDYQTSHPVILYQDSDLISTDFPSTSQSDLISNFYNNISPHTTNSNGITLHKDAVSDSNGITYSHSFSFSRLFSGSQPNKFEYFSFPLNTTDNYFMNPDNFYRGRELEFKILFKFDGSFAWNPDVSQGFSHIHAITLTPDDVTNQRSPRDYYIDCTNNVVQVSGHTHLEITCNTTLDNDYLVFVPEFRIYNPGYVWDSDSWWEFYSFYLVTDGDDTPGDRFNSDIVDNFWSPTDGVGGDGSCNDNDLLCKINNIFIFSIPLSSTPLGGILGNFSSQSSCASIPTIAGLIHSNETQICPWFSSNVRSIATPVLSLFSVCLVFGFIVRWLKSSSGDNMLNSHKNGDKD